MCEALALPALLSGIYYEEKLDRDGARVLIRAGHRATAGDSPHSVTAAGEMKD